MRARLITAAAVLGLLAAGCGGDGGRRAVSDYIQRVDEIQLAMNKPLVEVSKANRDFASKKGADPAKLARRLESSTTTLRTLHRRLERVEAPAKAERLHTLLLELADREASLAAEIERLVRFIPGFNAALQPVAGAGRQLKTALTGKGSAEAKAAALERYAAVLGQVIGRLTTLDPPPSSRPVFAAQLSTLGQVRSAVTALAKALREKRSADVAPLLRRFDRAATANQSTAVQQAQIAAVKAYNGRIRRLDEITVEIAKERNRLQKALG